MAVATKERGARRLGRQTVALERPTYLTTTRTIAGRIEHQGPLSGQFNRRAEDLFGQKTWEQAEYRMLEEVVRDCLQQANMALGDIDLLLAGDLLNQIVSSNFAARELALPFYGLFGACSVSAEGLSLAGLLMQTGAFSNIIVATASHHLTAERQYRFPVELGVQRVPAQSWTATGAAAFLVSTHSDEENAPRITAVTTGTVTDLGLKDPNNMGAAMAPAAAHTIAAHVEESGYDPDDFDLVLTGDLGRTGLPLAARLLQEDHGLSFWELLSDAGIELYDERQDVHSGGSGPACSALVLAAKVLPAIQTGKLKRVLLVATGSLHSPTTYQQGESIPAIAHAVCLSVD